MNLLVESPMVASNMLPRGLAHNNGESADGYSRLSAPLPPFAKRPTLSADISGSLLDDLHRFAAPSMITSKSRSAPLAPSISAPSSSSPSPIDTAGLLKLSGISLLAPSSEGKDQNSQESQVFHQALQRMRQGSALERLRSRRRQELHQMEQKTQEHKPQHQQASAQQVPPEVRSSPKRAAPIDFGSDSSLSDDSASSTGSRKKRLLPADVTHRVVHHMTKSPSTATLALGDGKLHKPNSGTARSA